MKFATFIASFCLTLCGSVVAQVAAQNVIYVNGIQNTLDDCNSTKMRLQAILNESTNHSGTTKRTFKVTAVWNPQGWSGENDLDILLKDKRRLWITKVAEELYSDAFLNLVSPFDSNLAPDVPSAQKVVNYLDRMLVGSTSIEADKSITEGNLRRTQFAVNSIVTNVQAKQPAVLVAHSMGNLLANLAYAKLVVNNGATVNKMLKVVNVANTSFFSVNGLNFTHAADAALYSAASAPLAPDFSLESMALTEFWTRTTPRCPSNGICKMLMGVAPFVPDGPRPPPVPFVDKVLYHDMVATYMSEGRVSVRDAQRVVFTPGATRFRDRLEDFIYTAANALESCPARKYSASYKWAFSNPPDSGEANLTASSYLRLAPEGYAFALPNSSVPDSVASEIVLGISDGISFSRTPALTLVGRNPEGWKGVASYSLVNSSDVGELDRYPNPIMYARMGELVVTNVQNICTLSDNHAYFRIEGTFSGLFGNGSSTATVSDGRFSTYLTACKSGYKPKFRDNNYFFCVL